MSLYVLSGSFHTNEFRYADRNAHSLSVGDAHPKLSSPKDADSIDSSSPGIEQKEHGREVYSVVPSKAGLFLAIDFPVGFHFN